MTIAQLRQFVGAQIGLPDSFDGSMTAYGNLAREQQIELTQGMIAYIQSNPGSFTPAQVETARIEAPRAATLTPEDTSFSFSAFFNELETNAGNVIGAPLVSIGNGVSQAVNLVGTLLPILALVAVAVAVWPYIARAKTAGAAPAA
jgi:hypothetical protein